MDTFSVKMVLLSNSASTFVIELNGVEAESDLEAGQMAMAHVLTHGAQVAVSAGLPLMHIKPASAMPFDVKKTNLVSVAASLPPKGLLINK